jgi:ribosomal protein S18 acetylase RimI-like enzyme
MLTLPAEWTTERLRISTAALDEAVELHAAFNACSDLESFDPTFHPVPVETLHDLIRKSLALGSDSSEAFHLQGIRLRETRELLGYFHVSYRVPEPGTVWISMFVLHPRYQRGGYGGEVIRQLLEQLRMLGSYDAVWLRVYLKNWTALRFWIDRGFSRIVRYEGASVHAPDAAASLVLEHRIRHTAG